MRRAYRVLAYLIAVEVIVQAMMIATGVAGLDHWIEHDHATVTKQVLDKDPSFSGSFGFAVHAINGETLIPLLAIALLIERLHRHQPDLPANPHHPDPIISHRPDRS